MIGRRSILKSIGAGGIAACSPRLTAAPASGEDIAIIREALALHPGLYRYQSPREHDARMAALASDYADAPDPASRYLILTRFLAAIRCGHSYCNFYNQSKTVQAELFDRPTRLPFAFRWIGRQMVVTADRSGTNSLKPGTIVTTINGVRAREMLKNMLPYARADGHNDAKRIAQLEMRGTEEWEAFDIFHGLLFGAPPAGVHRVTANGRTIELPAALLAERRAHMARPAETKADAAAWTWTVCDDGIALLDMPGWALYNSKWDWQGWLDDRLSDPGGMRGLIIDLRENEGGLDCGNAILARLADRDLSFPSYERRVRFRQTPASIDRYLDTWDDSFRTLGVDAEDLGTGFYRLKTEAGVETIAAKGPRVTVPVAALIGPVNSSATFQFAAKCRSTGLIRLFGEPTGGNRRGINGGSFFFVRLPQSGLEFDLPLVGTFPTVPQPDSGILPDVRVPVRAADIAAGHDAVRAAAAAWIRATA